MSKVKGKAYLSNAMTGHDDFNYPWFHRITKALRAEGWLVVNPAESFAGDQSLPFRVYMEEDIRQLLRVDTIIVGPEWSRSPGAVLEVAIGAALGHEILAVQESPFGLVLEPAMPLFDLDRERLALVLRGGMLEAAPAAGPEPMSTWAEADEGLLKAADHIVNGDRQRTYGHPINHHTTTAELWSSYLTRVNDPKGEGPCEVVVRPQDVSILMVLDKVSRIGGGDKVDNVLDIAGYAQVHAKVRAKQEQPQLGVFA